MRRQDDGVPSQTVWRHSMRIAILHIPTLRFYTPLLYDFTGIVLYSGTKVLHFGDGFFAVPFGALGE